MVARGCSADDRWALAGVPYRPGQHRYSQFERGSRRTRPAAGRAQASVGGQRFFLPGAGAPGGQAGPADSAARARHGEAQCFQYVQRADASADATTDHGAAARGAFRCWCGSARIGAGPSAFVPAALISAKFPARRGKQSDAKRFRAADRSLRRQHAAGEAAASRDRATGSREARARDAAVPVAGAPAEAREPAASGRHAHKPGPSAAVQIGGCALAFARSLAQ
jgi:hypothetical protein